MFVTWTEDSKDKAVVKARSVGIDLVDPSVPCWGVSKETLDLGASWEEGGANLTTYLEFGVRRNVALVAVNPKLGEFVGYQPAAPTLLAPGHFGPVEVRFKSPADAEAAFLHLAGDWAVKVLVAVVGSPARD